LVETSLISGRQILRGIAQYARDGGPWTVYHEPRSLEAAVPGWLKTWRGDGIIARLQNRAIADGVAATGLPAVDVLGVAGDTGIPLVHVDNAAIGRLAAEHLLELGFRQFGFCGFAEVNWACQRRGAFVETVRDAGCPCSFRRLPVHVRSDLSWETLQDRLSEWIRGLPKPVGIMACYDPVGQKVSEACRRAGVSVPEEVAVLGVDNDETVCEVCNPPLSSVKANHFRVGYEAAALLDRLMRGEKPPAEPVYVEPTGVAARLSTDVLAVGDPEVAAALALIRERACDGLKVSDVVARIAISRTALKERFRRVMGRTMRDEIIRTQLKRAQMLLAGSDLSLRSIALKSGFRHPEYMGAVFRVRLGKSPGQFRREAKVPEG
jgi:LacI family transcriptional regulator